MDQSSRYLRMTVSTKGTAIWSPNIPMRFPLLIYIQQCQVITFRYEKLFTSGITFFLSLRWPIENGWNREHRHDCQHLGSTLVFSCGDQHFRERWFHRKVRHFATSRRQIADVVEGAQYPELIHRIQDILLGRRIHEVEFQEVLDPKGLEQQNSIRQIRSLNFGNIARIQLVDVCRFGIQTVAESRFGGQLNSSP